MKAASRRGTIERGELHDEARTAHRAVDVEAVLGADRPGVRLDDLLGDAQAEAGVDAEFLRLRALAVETIEDRLLLAGRDAGAVVLDRHPHRRADAHGVEPDTAARRAERQRVRAPVGTN